jgi:hypothetical protein
MQVKFNIYALLFLIIKVLASCGMISPQKIKLILSKNLLDAFGQMRILLKTQA